MRKSQYYTMLAMFAAASGAIAEMHIAFPFPLLPFLEFDLAEIPDTLAFMILGPKGGLISAGVHALILYIIGSFTIFSPAMKLFAELSMFAGIYFGFKVGNKSRHKDGIMAGFGSIFRVIVMLFVTLALYYVIMPSIYLPTAKLAMSILGISLASPFEIAMLLAGLTSVFNLLAGLITIIIAFAIIKSIIKIFPQLFPKVY
ncbi:MAG: hypothetical protein QXH66_02100 [Conexivisphaerales archaeon]